MNRTVTFYPSAMKPVDPTFVVSTSFYGKKHSRLRYLLLPVSSLVDWCHKCSGVPEVYYDPFRFFAFSFHCTVWLRFSLLITIGCALSLWNPLMREMVQLQLGIYETRHQLWTIWQMLRDIPAGGEYLEFYIFLEVAAISYSVLVTLGLISRIPVFFAPAQIGLLGYSLHLLWSIITSIGYNLNTTWNHWNELHRSDVKRRIYERARRRDWYESYDPEVQILYDGITKVVIFLTVLFLEYIVERAMQCYRYEHLVSNFRTYVTDHLDRKPMPAPVPFDYCPPQEPPESPKPSSEAEVEMFWIGDELKMHETRSPEPALNATCYIEMNGNETAMCDL